MRVVLTAVLFILLSPAAYGEVIRLKNGDRITGTVTQSGDSVVINPVYGGEFSVPAEAVDSIEPGEVEETTSPEASQLPESIEQAIVSVKKPNEIKWDSRISLNSSFSRGNTDSNLINLQGDLKAQAGKHRYILDFSSLREEQDGDSTKEEDQLHFGYNYLYSNHWFFAVDTTAERDAIALLDHRLSVTPSVGYDFWNDDVRTLNMQLGAGYAKEKTDGDDESTASIDWRLKFGYKVLEGKMEIFHNHHVYRNMEGRKNTVYDTSTGVRYDITADIFINVQLDYDYDDDPVPGTDEDDLTFLVGAGIEF